MPTYPFLALALAAALLDVTLGYPSALARRIGSPSQWLSAWAGLVRKAGESWSGTTTLALYLAPVAVVATTIGAILPDGPLGFAATALLASTFCGRQEIDARAAGLLRVWEMNGAAAALAGAEALEAREDESRPSRALAAALAARFADAVVAPTLFILFAGLPGAAVSRALVVAGRAAGERRDPFGEAAAALEGFAIRPAAWLGALWLALAVGQRAVWRNPGGEAPTAPAEAVMLAALGDGAREHPARLRRALSIYRRAAALELAALAVLALFAAFGP